MSSSSALSAVASDQAPLFVFVFFVCVLLVFTATLNACKQGSTFVSAFGSTWRVGSVHAVASICVELFRTIARCCLTSMPAHYLTISMKNCCKSFGDLVGRSTGQHAVTWLNDESTTKLARNFCLACSLSSPNTSHGSCIQGRRKQIRGCSHKTKRLSRSCWIRSVKNLAATCPRETARAVCRRPRSNASRDGCVHLMPTSPTNMVQ